MRQQKLRQDTSTGGKVGEKRGRRKQPATELGIPEGTLADGYTRRKASYGLGHGEQRPEPR